MKKTLFYILFFITISSYSSVGYADDCTRSCTIKSAPLPDLLEYIADSKTILENVSDQIQNAPKQSYLQTQKDVIRNYNYYLFNWNSFFTRLEYSVELPLGSELPDEIQRDYKVIQKVIKYQNKYIQTLAKSGRVNAVIVDACGDIEFCNISGNAGQVAAQVLVNTHKIAEIYRLSLTGNHRAASAVEIDFGENISGNMINTYNPGMISNCSRCEGSTADIISKTIKNIGTNGANYKKGIKQWQDAMDLLWGRKKQSYREQQAELKKELKRQGASENTKKILLGNLEKYQNSNGGFIQNNFITNSIKGVENTFNKNWGNFDEAIKGDFNEGEKTQTNTTKFTQTIADVSSSDDIAQIVAGLYASSKPYAQTQDVSAAKALSKTIRMHEKLTNAIENLANTIEDSEETCKQQHRGDGICSAR